MSKPSRRIAACLTLSVLLPSAALEAALAFEIVSTSGNDLSATFEFSGSLDSDGTFNFDSSGNPLSNPSFSVSYVTSTNYLLSSSGSLSGSFTMEGTLSNGTNDFSSDGSPLSSPSLTSDFGSFSNQPNQNDDYIVTDGVVTALKYDLFGDESLNLSADGSYSIGDIGDTLETGTYSITTNGENTSGPHNFTNQPNQNDSYTISGGTLSAMKYDLSNGEGYTLNLRSDGSFELTDSFETLGSGTYEINPVPEPATYAIFSSISCLIAISLSRRKKSIIRRN